MLLRCGIVAVGFIIDYIKAFDSTYYEMKSGLIDTLYGAGDVDGAFTLWHGGCWLREVDGGVSLLHDLLDIRPASADDKQVMLRGDVQLHVHR